MKQTKLAQNGSSLLAYAISRFSPEIFSHPIWVRFGKKEVSVSIKVIDDLFSTVKNLQIDDPSAACQVLLVCAVYQNYAGQRYSAFKTAQQAQSLAEQTGLANETIWALWGVCAICFQLGSNEQTAIQLGDLEAELIERDEWVLANFVNVVKRSLLRPITENLAERAGTSREHQVMDLLKLTFDWLQRWGYFTQPFKTENFPNSKNSVSNATKKSKFYQSFFLIRSWQAHWFSLMYIFKRKMNRISQNVPLSPPSISVTHEQVFEMDGSAQLDKPSIEILSMHPSGSFRPPIEATPLTSVHKKNERKSAQEPLSLVVYCLGSFRVFQNEQLISSWNGLKSQCIFKYLISLKGKPVAKDILMDTFWPEADVDSARRNLHQAIYSLRQTLRRDHPDYAHVQFENNYYFLNPAMDVWCDFLEFEHKVYTGRRLESQGRLTEANTEYGIAESIYQGDFLEEDLYDEWPRAKREYLRVIYLEITERLIKNHLLRSDYTAASVLCRKVLNRDNCQEQVHRLLIQCYLAQGQRHLALRQYQTCVETLRKELDIEPAAATIALYKEISRGGSNNT